jgi:hypothetical protein
MTRLRWLTPALALMLAASALFAGVAPVVSAQQASGPGGGCYICGTLDYVLVEGAYWFGILAEDACPRYLGDQRASPESRRSYYNQVAARGKACSTADRVRNSGKGIYCGDNMPGKGTLYAGTVGGRIYSEPSTNSTLVGSPPSGTRLKYTNTTQVNGETWYYIDSPGRASGWMPGNQLSCIRPVEPPIPKRIIDPKDAGVFSGRGAQIAGARG